MYNNNDNYNDNNNDHNDILVGREKVLMRTMAFAEGVCHKGWGQTVEREMSRERLQGQLRGSADSDADPPPRLRVWRS